MIEAAAAAVSVRVADASDAPTISALAIASTRQHILPDQPPAAADVLLPWMAADAIGARIAAGHRHHVGEIGSQIVGVIATRDGSHVHLLVVDDAWQRRGIATLLWHHALDACRRNAQVARITVNSSAGAVACYRRLGFTQTGPARCENDVMSTPMEFRIEGNAG